MPGWFQDKDGWRYIQKNGYYLANTWYQDTDGKYYYFNMAAIMAVNTDTPDGYHVDENGVWDGNASTVAKETVNLGPVVQKAGNQLIPDGSSCSLMAPISPIAGNKIRMESGIT